MPKVVTLCQNHEFRRAYARGQSRADASLVSYALKNRLGYCRYGITTSKKIGSAVERNRCRRIIRAAYVSLAAQCCGGWDLVFVARTRTVQCKSSHIAQSMHRQLLALGVIPRHVAPKQNTSGSDSTRKKAASFERNRSDRQTGAPQ